MAEILRRLKQRKLVQWALAYVAAAFAFLQGIDIVAAKFGWPASVERFLIIAICIGFFVTLLLAWYHGEQGRQRATGTELLLIALVLAVGGGLLWKFAGTSANHEVAADAMSTARAIPMVASAYDNAQPASGATAIPAKSIAVLPFVNMSGDPRQDYFSDGITEEILNALAQAPDLQVAGRTSAFAFKGRNEDLRKIGAALGVAHVLEGSVQRAGDKVRITAQLIDTRTGYHLWSQKYDRKLTNVFAVEDEISKAIADKLQTQLRAGATASVGTRDVHAHELYLRGLTLLAARGPGLRDAADTFRQAVAIDPGYAQAWAALAQAEFLVHNWHYDTEGTAMRQADTAVRRALALDPDLAAAHLALGMIHAERWEWAEAERELRRALELAPNDAEALDQYAQFLHDTGNLQAALPVIERANRLDPYSGVIGGVHAMVLANLHRCEAAKAQLDRTLVVAPDSLFARRAAMGLALGCRDDVEAEVQARHYAILRGRSPEAYSRLVRGVVDPTQRSQALAMLAQVDLSGMELVYWRALLGDRAGALATLEVFVVKSGEGGAQVLWNQAFDPLRNDPRFKAVLKKMGLPYTPQDLPTQ